MLNERRIFTSKREAEDSVDTLSFPRQRKGLNAACWNSSADHAVHSNSSQRKRAQAVSDRVSAGPNDERDLLPRRQSSANQLPV